ncbi:MAG: hypothetical protein QM730_22835 [Anaerolineales bacterium]
MSGTSTAALGFALTAQAIADSSFISWAWNVANGSGSVGIQR